MHKFKLNQTVRILSDTTLGNASSDGLYQVIRLMPQDQAGHFGYRLRSAAGERVALENVLEPAGVPAQPD